MISTREKAAQKHRNYSKERVMYVTKNREDRLFEPQSPPTLVNIRTGFMEAKILSDICRTLALGFRFGDMTLSDVMFYRRDFSWYLYKICNCLTLRGITHRQVNEYMVDKELQSVITKRLLRKKITWI